MKAEYPQKFAISVMKFSLDLACESPKEWLTAVLSDFNSFLQDHADCERKASAMALSMVAKYPDRTEIIPELIETALEEMEHFQAVYKITAPGRRCATNAMRPARK